jgi:FtsX-like permease family
MTATLAATLTVSLRRMRAAWPIVLAAGLTCLLASSLLAAGPMYASAVSIAGLHRVLADAPVAEANIEVSLRSEPERADDVDIVVTDQLDRALEGVGGTYVRSARSESFGLPGQPTGDLADLVQLEYLEGLAERATLLTGSWPDDGQDGSVVAGAPVPVAVASHVAEPLGLAVGQILILDSRLHPGDTVPVRIAGIFSIDDPTDPAWWDEAQVLDGVVTSPQYATHGPFFTTRDALFERATPTKTELTWRAFPTPSALTVDGIDRVRTRVDALDASIEASLDGVPTTVASGLPAILATAQRSLLVSRTGVLLLVIQLVVLAAYAVLLSAALLVEHRRVDTAMLRSRGAGPVRIAALALVEGLVLVIPAAVFGPWLAYLGLQLFNVIGPLADIGLRVDPTVAIDAYIAASAAALACLLALLLPAIPTRRSFAAVQSGISRAGTRPAGQRLGLDIALLAIAAIGLWQLRQYGAPLTRSVQGAVGIDPLLVAAPAIGLLAGAVLALRVLPMLAVGIERITSRGRGLVSSLGARQLARRPLRYTRAALLLILAMAMGVFAVSYTWTWTASQRDQATFQVGADIRVDPSTRSGDPPRWALDRRYAALPGLTARMPLDRASIEVTGTDRAELLALDAAAAPAIVALRPDLADASVASLMAPLAAQRPTLTAVPIPDGTRHLRLTVAPDLRALDAITQDPDTGEASASPVDLALYADAAGLSTSVVVRDATGALYRFGGQTGTLGADRQTLDVPLGDASDPNDAFAGPLELVGVELGVLLPQGLQTSDASITLEGVTATGSDPARTETPLDLDLAGGWRLTSAVHGGSHEAVERTAQPTDGSLVASTGPAGLIAIDGVDRYGRGTVLAFAPAALSAIAAAPIPVLATRAFLEASARSIGETMSLEIAGVRRTVALVGVVSAFPTVDAASPALIVDLPTLALARFEGSDAVDPATEWWFASPEAGRARAVAALEARPFSSRSVLTIDGRTRALATDPVALGIIGALAIGFVAAALFAVVGFIVSAAVSARERVTEFALLRALGLSGGQLSSWLSLENAVLAGVSLVAGSLLGLVIAWVVLPFVTVTQTASTPYPPVALVVPWLTIAILEVMAIVALTTTVIVLAWLLRRVGLASALRLDED